MRVHIIEPYRLDKDLGRAYNEAMALVPDGDWCCLKDIDTCFLIPDAPAVLHRYAELYDTAVTRPLLTCFTNRVSTLSVPQLLNGYPDESSDMRLHIERAVFQTELGLRVTPIQRDISGFLMLISKSLWEEHKFAETGKCLGIDTEYNRRIRAAGVPIYRMDSVYIWHTYRLINGILDREHLK